MALNKITYTDKVALSPQPSVAAINKVSDSDMNEIKSVVNDAIDQVDTNTTNITNLSNYSSSEVATGEKWYNGKPIYRRVYYVSSLPNATATDYQHGISNVDKIWCDVGHTYIDWQSSVGTSPLPYIGGTSFNSMVEIRGFNSSKFTIDTHATDRRGLCAYVCINYTKTTD